MGAINFDDLRRHIGHKIVCVGYGIDSTENKPYEMVNVAVECEDCNEVLLDYDSEGR